MNALFESLESRQHLSACTLKGGLLSIDGTNKRDVINVTQKKATSTTAAKVCVTVNGQSQFFSAKSVKSIKVTARKGNDSINVASNVRASSCIDAGWGDDYVAVATTRTECIWDEVTVQQANSCTNTVYGGKGNDVIQSDTERLVCYGGEGDDQIYSDGGTDCIWGEGGDDYVDAGWSDDVIDCGDGDDQVDAGWGDDVIECSWGDDIVDCGDGDDEVNGGWGDDLIECGYGDDEVDGGDGQDQIDCGWGDDYVTSQDSSDYVCGYSYSGWFDFVLVVDSVCWF